jgi:hypothetical protein
MGCGEVDELAIEDDESGVHIHTLAVSLLVIIRWETDRLSSEPERRISPSSDHDRAFTHLRVSLMLAQLQVAPRDSRLSIPSMSIIRSTRSEDLYPV